MKFSSILVAGLATVTSAQSIAFLTTKIPACALNCFEKIVPPLCGNVFNYKCQCAMQDELTVKLRPCVLPACGTSNALAVQRTALEICSVYSEKHGVASAASSSGPSTMSSGGGAAPAASSNTGPTAFSDAAAPMATAGPIGAAIAAAIAFAI